MQKSEEHFDFRISFVNNTGTTSWHQVSYWVALLLRRLVYLEDNE